MQNYSKFQLYSPYRFWGVDFCFGVYVGGGGGKIISLILSRVGWKREIPEKNHLTTSSRTVLVSHVTQARHEPTTAVWELMYLYFSKNVAFQ